MGSKSKRITSQDVANLAGVSRTTVSFVLNNVEGFQISPETRQKVLDAAAQLGYVPDSAAQTLASRRARAIGLVMTRSPHHIASDSFLPQIISGLLKVTKTQNLRLMIEQVDAAHQSQAYLELARAKRIDGMILLTPRMDDEALVTLETAEIPAVLMGHLPGSNLYSVDVDNRAAAEQAVRYLLSLGHRRIACITNAPASYTAAPQRVQGYLDALTSAGIEPNPALIRYADFDPESGYERMKSLLQGDEPFTAVFVASDNVAIGAKSAIREAGLRVPDDVSMMGFDDIPWSRYSDPPLSTVHLPAEALAQQACVMLLDLIQGQLPPTKHLNLETELIVRKSCRALA
ncbi:MAG: LacI family transcriptional regulator [Anaerolineales bacterium]|nr:LacI family transcriptional regulator [Anaerolineales bacterium]MCX7755032.1 LacI family transcriptional regulator [Anaerolineales bacterium]MDW8279238.1 LacI family DNA-binding transcriptional regulator [Anaerolineales bacterium]